MRNIERWAVPRYGELAYAMAGQSDAIAGDFVARGLALMVPRYKRIADQLAAKAST